MKHSYFLTYLLETKMNKVIAQMTPAELNRYSNFAFSKRLQLFNNLEQFLIENLLDKNDWHKWRMRNTFICYSVPAIKAAFEIIKNDKCKLLPNFIKWLDNNYKKEAQIVLGNNFAEEEFLFSQLFAESENK